MMQYFPTTCIDGFFTDPEQIIELTKEVNWQPSDGGHWPGVRSQPLHEIDYDVYNWIMNKYLSAFFSEEEKRKYNIGYRSTSMFQRIPANTGEGWIHTDYPDVHTFIIYLTPGADERSGTSLYSKKNIRSSAQYTSSKQNVYLGKGDDNGDRERNNSQFVRNAFFGNVYNRCIGFDSSLWHGVENFDTGQEDRLTLITFFHSISCGSTPLQRLRSQVMIKD